MGQIHRLSARTIATKKRRGLYCDGGGLYLQIAEGGTKTWIFRFRSPLTKKPRHMGIGSLNSVGLPEGQTECGNTAWAISARRRPHYGEEGGNRPKGR